MKKRLSIFAMALAFVLAVIAAGSPAITFSTMTHDFGNVKAKGGAVTYDYKFTNTGNAPLVIISVSNGGCGCTTPAYPKAPIAPGKSGVITIKFNPAGRSGEFDRVVNVKTNVKGKKIKLRFSGVVIP